MAFDNDMDSSSCGDSLNDSVGSWVGSTTTSFTGSQKQHREESEDKAREDHGVATLNWVVTALLIASSLGVSLSVAFASEHREDSFYRQAFDDDTEKLFDHIGLRGQQNINTMASLGVSLTSYSTSASPPVSWPFVMVPDFDLQAATTLDILDTSSTVFVCPTVVEGDERLAWERYSNENQPGISPYIYKIADGKQVLDVSDENRNTSSTSTSTSPDAPDTREDDAPPHVYYPAWQIAPLPDTSDVKFNLGSIPSVAAAMDHVRQHQVAVISSPLSAGSDQAGNGTDQIDLLSVQGAQEGEPVSLLLLPIFDSFDTKKNRTVVGLSAAPFTWKSYLDNAFAAGTRGFLVVFFNPCGGGQTFTYEINESTAEYVGQGDLHLDYYDDSVQSASLSWLIQQQGFTETADGIPLSEDYDCQYQVRVYPSAAFQNQHMTNGAILVTSLTVVIFALTLLLFLAYGGSLQGRFETLSNKAARTTKLVNTLFPKEVQERMFKEGAEANGLLRSDDPLAKIKNFLDDKEKGNNDLPIADLFPACTVMFADISGFTAWSSGREPVQVFVLLEAIYKNFDMCAKRRGVFKVETIGDCYVAVVGLPTPRKDHAVVMARFARECRDNMTKVTRKLEVTLGPDTADLQLRIGLNSGPVTAGVLRGEKGRFQLFGDTVNTAARMESNGRPTKIHVSASTAEVLISLGKDHWVSPREDMIEAKGKGKMKTFWVEPGASGGSATTGTVTSTTPSFSDDEDLEELFPLDDKTMRLVEWNVDVLSRLIRQIGSHREASRLKKTATRPSTRPLKTKKAGDTVIDEVVEIIELAEFEATVDLAMDEKRNSPEVVTQLRQFVATVGGMYRNNPFHNFEHASHVTMSVTKLMSRIVAPNNYDGKEESAASLHDRTYGLASDPLTQFACVFAALIHDADHPGVPNSTLVKEEDPLAAKYNDKSVAEQNSIDIVWDLLQQSFFSDLRNAICATQAEQTRFRQLVVNAVMATDIMDKDLIALRNARWAKAFGEETTHLGSEQQIANRKATIVIEHLIQASDIAHTMQHWHIYRKWNERLFTEMYHAYKTGRSEKDPSEFWYRGEIGFFDFYIIPLARKLSNCGVFGLSSQEYLNYAKRNRDEWEETGEEIVANMIKRARQECPTLGPTTSSADTTAGDALQPEASGAGATAGDVLRPETSGADATGSPTLRPESTAVGDDLNPPIVNYARYLKR